MKKVLVMSDGRGRLCVDMQFVDRVIGWDKTVSVDWETGLLAAYEVPEGDAFSTIYSLAWLLGRMGRGKGGGQMIILQDQQYKFCLYAEGGSAELDLEPGALRPLPKTFPAVCREYFPTVAVADKWVLPVVTPESIAYLEQWKRQGTAINSRKAAV